MWIVLKTIGMHEFIMLYAKHFRNQWKKILKLHLCWHWSTFFFVNLAVNEKICEQGSLAWHKGHHHQNQISHALILAVPRTGLSLSKSLCLIENESSKTFLHRHIVKTHTKKHMSYIKHWVQCQPNIKYSINYSY